jgi:hypothetical protein
MRMEVVNGYVCFGCTDAARAKKGEDPATKPNSPEAQGDVPAGPKDDAPSGVNRPLAFGDRGTQVNLLL